MCFRKEKAVRVFCGSLCPQPPTFCLALLVCSNGPSPTKYVGCTEVNIKPARLLMGGGSGKRARNKVCRVHGCFVFLFFVSSFYKFVRSVCWDVRVFGYSPFVREVPACHSSWALGLAPSRILYHPRRKKFRQIFTLFLFRFIDRKPPPRLST